MVECIFMDGKCMIEFILNKKKKHGLIPQFQILYLFGKDLKLHRRELVHLSVASIPNGGFPQDEMTSDFAVKSRRNYFATKLNSIFTLTTLTRLLKHQK